jgi:transglutaminase-like putative cysteine protease
VLLATLIGALAVLGGSTALLPLLDSTSWVLPLVEVVAVIWLVGVGARLLRAPAWAVVLLQIAGMLIALTSLFTSSGIGGVLPGPAAVRDGGTLLHDAWQQILTTVPPAPSTPELGFLIALSVGGAALLVDVLIAEVRTPALVALPLLSLFSVPASIAIDMLPWYAFVAPAALFAVLLAVAGHTGWHPQTRARVSLGISGSVIAAITIVGSLLLANAATPIGTAGRLPRGDHPGGQIGLNPWALLHGNLQTTDPVDMMRVTGLERPAYLRTMALEKWTPDQGFGFGPVVADASDLDGAVPGSSPGSDTRTVTITPQDYRDKYLPIFPGTSRLTGLATGWNYDKQLQTVFRQTPTTPQQYTVTADFATVSAEQLETENVHSGGPLTETGNLPSQVVSLANSITAGALTPFDQAQAVLDYFKNPDNGFRYSLRVPTGNSGSALLDFLTNKEGYCEQYAAAMTIMLRAIGIPARVAVGFTQGIAQPDGSYQVVSTDAHAWVEVKFDTVGWVAFDPTPVVDGQGGLQGFLPGGSGGGGGTAEPTGTATTSATATTSTTHSLTGAAVAPGRKIDGADQSYQTGEGAGTGSSAVWRWVSLVLLILGPLLVVALLVAAPSIIRRMRRRRRLALAASGRPGAATAAWAEIEDTLADHGIVVREVESARVTANRLARTAHLSTTGRESLRTVVTTAEREWYGSADGQQPDLAPGVLAVVDGLERSAPRALMDRVVPRSLRRGSRG